MCRIAVVGSVGLAVAYVCGAVAPMEWTPVQTNQIARWKAEHRAPGGVAVDPATRTVRFLAEATGVNKEEPIEFFAIGPLSDRAYESFCVTVASPAAIAAALESVGVPRGVPPDPLRARMWPQGEKVTMQVRLCEPNARPQAASAWIVDGAADEAGHALKAPLAYTGGTRQVDGSLVAATNLPCAVLALYRHGPSLLALDGQYDQSSTYGRFRSACAMTRGALMEVILSWDGKRRVTDRTVTVSAGQAGEVLASLKKEASDGMDVYARVAWAPDVTVAQAAVLAQAFDALDGKGLKMNGTAPDAFFYRAFLPDPSWRTRTRRLFQPFEIHLSEKGERAFTFVEEDWSGEGSDPVLRPRMTAFQGWTELPALIAATGDQGSKVSVAFLFAPPDTPVARLAPVVRTLSPRIDTFYVFAGEAEGAQ
jgi:hypothetical protein